MKVCLTAIVSDNYYQLYLPLFIYTLHREYPEYEVKTFIKGKVSEQNARALAVLEKKFAINQPIEIFSNIKEKKSTLNCLRFLIHEKHFKKYDYVIFLDADLLIYKTSPTLLEWHLKRMKKIGSCYAGHHGPWRKRYRPQIAPNGWRGSFERVSGGLFLATPKWFEKTHKIRKTFLSEIMAGKLCGYREADEVMLCNILKKSGLPVPPMGFPKELRGVHLGDFKPGMKKRYLSNRKMNKKLTLHNAKKYIACQSDETWKEMIKIIYEERHIKKVIDMANIVISKKIRHHNV